MGTKLVVYNATKHKINVLTLNLKKKSFFVRFHQISFKNILKSLQNSANGRLEKTSLKL